jgi:RNA polymerase sigma factor for flagellar operon FliA
MGRYYGPPSATDRLDRGHSHFNTYFSLFVLHITPARSPQADKHSEMADAPSRRSLCSPLSADDRERLILEHMPQVKLIARKIHARFPGHVDLDDLISTGVLGLIAAIDRYDPSRGVQLKTYAEYKIRGAILDSVRNLDNASRDDRRRARMIEHAREHVEQQLKRIATPEEVAAELEISLEEYREVLQAVANTTTVSLDAKLPSDETEFSMSFMKFAQATDQTPEDAIADSQLREYVADAVADLAPQEGHIISLLYGRGLTMREAAPLLNLSEWQIQERRRRAIDTLRQLLTERWNLALVPAGEPV